MQVIGKQDRSTRYEKLNMVMPLNVLFSHDELGAEIFELL